jgi:predicted transcriptional regulator
MPRLKCKPIPSLSPRDITRFWSKVDKSPGQGPKGECWQWQAATSDSGYGFFCYYIGGPFKSLNLMAHRVAFVIQKGEDPVDLLVCHTCDNPPCCNGSHLFKGTEKDNAVDRQKKGRGRSWLGMYPEEALRGEGCPAAKLTDTQVKYVAELWADGWSQKEIGKLLGVHQGTISHIIMGNTWKHLGIEIPEIERRPVHFAILNPDKVRYIRSLITTGMSQQTVADMLSVSRGAVQAVIDRKSWVWVE